MQYFSQCRAVSFEFLREGVIAIPSTDHNGLALWAPSECVREPTSVQTSPVRKGVESVVRALLTYSGSQNLDSIDNTGCKRNQLSEQQATRLTALTR